MKEWRELLTTLANSLTTIIRCSTSPQTIEVLNEGIRAHISAGEVLNYRLFIAQVVRQGKIPDRWGDATVAFEKDHDPKAFGTAFGNIAFLIESMARSDISKV